MALVTATERGTEVLGNLPAARQGHPAAGWGVGPAAISHGPAMGMVVLLLVFGRQAIIIES